LPASIVQSTSPPAGRVSVTLSPVAVPAVLLVKVTVKPICEPAFTLTASAVLPMVTVAHSTVSESDAEPEPSLSVVKLIVLSYVPQLWPVVSLTTCAVVLVLPSNVVGE